MIAGEKIMKKQKILFGILAASILFIASLASAGISWKNDEKQIRPSPLFKKNIKLALGEKLEKGKISNFIGSRIFFLPKLPSVRQTQIIGWTDTFPMPTACAPTCFLPTCRLLLCLK